MKKRKPTSRVEITTVAGTKYDCYLFPEPADGYVVSCLGVSSLAAHGATLEEARANAREEIEAWEEEAERLRAHYRAVCYDQCL